MLLSLLLTMVQVQSSYILCIVILFETLNTSYHVGDQIFELKILYLLFFSWFIKIVTTLLYRVFYYKRAFLRIV